MNSVGGTIGHPQKLLELRQAYLENKCAGNGFALQPMDDDANSPLRGRRAIVLAVEGASADKAHPQFWFNQHVSNTLFRWEWCVKFDGWHLGKSEKLRALPEAKDVTAIMEETLEMPRKHGWDGYRRYTDDSKGLDRTLEDELAKQTAVSECFEGGRVPSGPARLGGGSCRRSWQHHVDYQAVRETRAGAQARVRSGWSLSSSTRLQSWRRVEARRPPLNVRQHPQARAASRRCEYSSRCRT